MRVATAVLAFVTVLVATSCGGGKSTLSKDAYASRAIAICEKAGERAQALPDPAAATTKAEGKRRIDAIIANDRRTLAELGALHPSSGFASTANAWLSSMRAGAAAWHELLWTSLEGHVPKTVVARGNAAGRRSHALATQLGVLPCVEGTGG